MKNFLSLLLTAAVLFSGCKKNNAAYIASDPNSLDGASVISTGKMAFSDERYNEGMAKIYLRKNNVYVLALEQMNYESMFDTDIYLSATPGVTTASIKIFSAKKLHVNIYHDLSSGIDIPAFKYVIIQNDAAAGPVATAMLQ